MQNYGIVSLKTFLNQTCQLPNRTFTVGRSQGNDIVMRADPVSQNRFELLGYDPEVIGRDKGSKNSASVSEVRVNAPKGVRDGYGLRLGKVKIRWQPECEKQDNTTVILDIDEIGKFQESEK
jgi:pSer/pThr/pTyr-binding forkhead associated (FHA) protein